MKFFLDNTLPPAFAKALNVLGKGKTKEDHSVQHLSELFDPSTQDIVWLNKLSEDKSWILLSGDMRITKNPHERKAWKESGLDWDFAMGYYIRVLSTSEKCVPLSTLKSAIKSGNWAAKIDADSDSEDWEQIILSHSIDLEIASIERNPVGGADGTLGAEELDEFAEEIADHKPQNATKWLLDYFKRVRCIYAFQLLSGTEQKNGWEILGAVKNCVWNFAPSIIQADGEGFSNEAGYSITWQFSESAKGNWWMGVLRNGAWIHFQVDLGNKKHHESFLKGEVPHGAKLAK